MAKKAEDQKIQAQKKEEFAVRNTEREREKRTKIEVEILAKEQSVKRVQMKKKEDIQSRKIVLEEKRASKKIALQLAAEQVREQQVASLEKIEAAHAKFREQKRQKALVQVQVKLMREQLTIRK